MPSLVVNSLDLLQEVKEVCAGNEPKGFRDELLGINTTIVRKGMAEMGARDPAEERRDYAQ